MFYYALVFLCGAEQPISFALSRNGVGERGAGFTCRGGSRGPLADNRGLYVLISICPGCYDGRLLTIVFVPCNP